MYVIEGCAQAHGARYQGRPIGLFGHINKDHCKSYDAVFNRKHPIGFRWLHESFRTNGRLKVVQSAIGRILIKQTHDWLRKRKVNSNQISVACSRFSSLRVPQTPDYIEHPSYKHYVFFRPDQLKSGWTRDRIMNEIIQLGVPCYIGGCPEVYLEKVFDETDFRTDKSVCPLQKSSEKRV